MKYILTGSQMKKADKYTIEHIGIPSMVLMERAALKVVEIMEQESVDFSKTLVVCGSGNNGGDGYAIARLLHVKGYETAIYFAGNDSSRSLENQAQKKIAEYYQIPVVQDLEGREYSVIIDAVFGIGLTREITGDYRRVIETLNSMGGMKVAVDMPSGIHDETAQVMGTAFRADLTIAIAYRKRGHIFQPGNAYVGKVLVADIGIYDDSLADGEYLTYCYEKEDLKKRFPKRKANSHKGSYGKVLLIAGSKGMSGAAYLSAKAAYAVGAGLVRVYTHEENRVILQQLLPEAIITTYETYDRAEVSELLAWADVVGIGCGLGKSENALRLVEQVVKEAVCPCVVDADALNILSENMEYLINVKQPMVLTPHMKEMARLLTCSVQELSEKRMDYLSSMTNTYPVTCVLKDARTLVAKKNKDTYVNVTGNSAMAKGGSGDVLTGIIAGIMAQKTESYEAACLGVFLHGMAGDEAKAQKGEYSVFASDLIESAGKVLQQL